MALYIYKKHIRQKWKQYFRIPLIFHMEKAILVVKQSVIVEKKLLKW